MNPAPPRAEWFRTYDLTAARTNPPPDTPAEHQHAALSALGAWYHQSGYEPLGGVLVLPTGGGKTYTAVHFLCRSPLSEPQPYKVLWLAHTHHLLEQAAETFEKLAGLVHAPRASLNLRVVSGTPGHCPVHTIQPSDDVVISTLQTARHAISNNEQFENFLDAAGERLFIVFDEAHHSPAPSYRRMLEGLRERFPRTRLLGLTATPTHTAERQRGWFIRLFPQGIVHQVTASELIAARVLARPEFEEIPTEVVAEFTDEQYQMWARTNRDLPDSVISALAENRERNERIVNHYVSRRDRYGRTIIFADRWPQCVALCQLLESRGVRAGAVFSHRDAQLATTGARNARREDENRENIRRFREGNLDVLVNIRMLTEGTDIPDAQTVFLTRQTTSQILLTQMIGRALRGPRFRGTERAYIVSFVDEWRHLINWAVFDQFRDGPADDRETDYRDRLPIQWVSIELVRRLARQMDSGVNVNPAPFREFLPAGWYHVRYTSAVAGTDDTEPIDRLVMVFAGDEERYERLITRLARADLSAFEGEGITPDEVRNQLEGWDHEFFDNNETRVGSRAPDILAVARHLAHNDGCRPRFFPFEARDQHDLDAVAHRLLDRDLGPRAVEAELRVEYAQPGRYWPALYHTFERFRHGYQGCVNRLLDAEHHGPSLPRSAVVQRNEAMSPREPDETVRAEVFRRDGMTCVCCQFKGQARQLRLDHITPFYHGGASEVENLQTLCVACNTAKGAHRVSFRSLATRIDVPIEFPQLQVLRNFDPRDRDQWRQFVRRFVNLFYRCAAVHDVDLASSGPRFYRWTIRLRAGHDPIHLRPHLQRLVDFIRECREDAQLQATPDEIEVIPSGG